jgi:hypothetical protein
MQVESALLFETPGQIYGRVFRELRPRTQPPEISVEFCRFANPDSYAEIAAGRLRIRISDLLEGAPTPVLEALAHILLSKLFRKQVPRAYTYRYRLYLNRRDMRNKMHLVRQIRGRKFVSGPQGEYHNLETIFQDLNIHYFDGLLAQPLLGWSRRPARCTLGHFDPSHNAIILSRILDTNRTPRLALEYVLYHEMLHLRFPVEAKGARRTVHTREFRAAEQRFEGLKAAKELLKKL